MGPAAGYLAHDLPAIEHDLVPLPESVLWGGLHVSCRGVEDTTRPEGATRAARPALLCHTAGGKGTQHPMAVTDGPEGTAGSSPHGSLLEHSGPGQASTGLSSTPPPRAAVRSNLLTEAADPSVHKKDNNANEGQGQEGSDGHARQLGEVTDTEPVSKGPPSASQPRPQADTGVTDIWEPARWLPW